MFFTFGTPGLEPASVVKSSLSATSKALSILGLPGICFAVFTNAFTSSLFTCGPCKALNGKTMVALVPYVIRAT